MGRTEDLAGARKGRLTVQYLCYLIPSRVPAWVCLCDCGTVKIITAGHIRRGATQSCGCLRREWRTHCPKGQSKVKDMTGLRFGTLTVIQRAPRPTYYKGKAKFAFWKVRCDCGKEYVASGINLRAGAQQNCGCAPHKRWLADGEQGLKSLKGSYIKGANERGLEYNITDEEFKHITSQKCFYCGLEPKQVSYHHDSKLGKRVYTGYIYNGIDRFHNDQGYIFENCIPCCKQCNFAKRDLDPESFIQWVLRTAKHITEGPNENSA